MSPATPQWLSVIVYPRNNIRLLTHAQLFEIFLGKHSNWREIGGNLQRQILPLLDQELYDFLWPQELPLGQRTILLDYASIKREVVKQPGAIGLMLCQSPVIRGSKVIAVRGRKRLGKWKNWPISLSVESCKKFLNQLTAG